MRNKEKANRRNQKMSDKFTIRLKGNKCIKIIPKVNKNNQISSLKIARFEGHQNVGSIIIGYRDINRFLSGIDAFRCHFEDEIIDPRLPEITRYRIA